MSLFDPSSASARGDAIRWGLGFIAAVVLHLASVLALLSTESAGSPPSPVIMLDLALLPTAPVEEPSDIPPGPKQVESAPPEEPEVLPEMVPLPEPPVVAEHVEVPIPKPKPKRVVPKEERQPPPVVTQKVRPERPPAEETTAPEAADVAPDVVAAAPPMALPASRQAPLPSWQSLLLAHLERHKRYPESARSRRQEGVVHLRFTVQRNGEVLDARIGRSSGYQALDQAVLAMIRRAVPLPAFPPEMAPDRIDLVVPIRFFLR